MIHRKIFTNPIKDVPFKVKHLEKIKLVARMIPHSHQLIIALIEKIDNRS